MLNNPLPFLVPILEEPLNVVEFFGTTCPVFSGIITAAAGFKIPSEKTAEIALRTQQVIAYETGIPEVTDPLAGSYYIESLTNEIINKTEKLITKVDDLGGAIKGIEMEFHM